MKYSPDIEKKAIGLFGSFEHQSVGLLYVLFGIAGLVTNGMLFRTMMREPFLPPAKKILHINLALANILIGLLFPFSGSSSFKGRWLYGDLGCQIYGAESFSAGTAAVTFVIAICFERYLASCHKQLYEATTTTTWTLVAALCWLHGLFWGLVPLLGWSSYAIEPSGTACGIDWVKKDYNHASYLVVLTFFCCFLYVCALMCLRSSKLFWDSHIQVPTEDKKRQEWFSEIQLIWVTIALLCFVIVGWGPYAYFSLWAAYSDATSITMMAVVLPPLFAKGATCLYALPYIITSEKFRLGFLGDSTSSKEE